MKYKTIVYFIGAGCSVSYFYNRHMYEQELFNRMNYLMINKVELSGVYIQQRQAFNWLWYIQWWLPYHQSLKICDKNTEKVRHVGLGKNKDDDPVFIEHVGEKYKYLNTFDVSIPVECWVDYYRQFGYYPSNINIDVLNKITITKQEALNNNQEYYKAKYGSIIKYCNETSDEQCHNVGIPTILTCRSAVMNAIVKEQQIRNGKLDISKMYTDEKSNYLDFITYRIQANKFLKN